MEYDLGQMQSVLYLAQTGHGANVVLLHVSSGSEKGTCSSHVETPDGTFHPN